MGKIVGKFRKIPEKNRNIVGIFWKKPKKCSKNSRKNPKNNRKKSKNSQENSKNSREKCRVFPWLEKCSHG